MAKQANLKAKLSLDSSQYEKGIKNALKSAEGFAKTVGGYAVKSVEALTAALSASAVAIAYGVKKSYDLGRELNEMSKKTGIAVDELLILNKAAKFHGVEDISTAIKKMQVNLVEAADDGASPAARALETLGLKASELLRKTPFQQFKLIGKAIGEIKNPARAAAEAVAFFGKTGAEMLPLFRDPAAFDKAQKAIGRQAQILKENADRFEAVSRKLNGGFIKLSAQGFFIGIAEKILPLVESVTEKFQALDLATQGERFGEGIREAVNFLAGAFADPSGFVDVMIDFLKAGLLEAANLFSARMIQKAVNFAADMLDNNDMIASALMAAMEYAFQEATVFFTGGWKGALVSLGGGLLDMFTTVIDFFSKGLENAWKFIKQGPSFLEGARDKLRSGVEDVKFGQKKTFGEFYEDSKGGFNADKAKALRKSVEGLLGTDFFGAGAYFDKAKAAGEKLRAAGKLIVDAYVQSAKHTAEKQPWKAFTNTLENNGGLQTSSNAGTSGSFIASTLGLKNEVGQLASASSLNRGAFNQTPLIHAAERRANENSLVALGITNRDSRGSHIGAHHVVRAGDRSRLKNVAIERERQNQKNQAKNIAATAESVAAIANGLGFKGAAAGGGE